MYKRQPNFRIGDFDPQEYSISKTVEIKDLEIPENAVLTLLGAEGVLDWKQSGKNLVVELPENFEKQYAHTIKIAG